MEKIIAASPLASLDLPTILVGGFDVSAVGVSVVVIFFILAALALRGKGMLTKLAAIFLALLSTAGLAVAYTEQLSHSKPLQLAWLQAQGEKGVQVYSSVTKAPEHIYLLIDIDGEPRNFKIPWSQKLEESLSEAAQALQEGAGGDLFLHFEPSLETDLKFYALPWPAPLPKDYAPQKAPRYVTPKVQA